MRKTGLSGCRATKVKSMKPNCSLYLVVGVVDGPRNVLQAEGGSSIHVGGHKADIVLQLL